MGAGGRFVGVDEEAFSGDGSGSALACEGDVRVERKERGREIGCGVGVGEGAADGSAVADLEVADGACRLDEKWGGRGDEAGAFDLAVGCRGADVDGWGFCWRGGGSADAGEGFDSSDVDDVLGLHEAHLHSGDEAHTAGEQAGFAFVLAEQAERFGGVGGGVVGECGGDHGRGSIASAAARAEATMFW